jgi:hypothetical protein
LSADDVFVSGGRQKPITEANIIGWMNQEAKDELNKRRKLLILEIAKAV